MKNCVKLSCGDVDLFRCERLWIRILFAHTGDIFLVIPKHRVLTSALSNIQYERSLQRLPLLKPSNFIYTVKSKTSDKHCQHLPGVFFHLSLEQDYICLHMHWWISYRLSLDTNSYLGIPHGQLKTSFFNNLHLECEDRRASVLRMVLID